MSLLERRSQQTTVIAQDGDAPVLLSELVQHVLLGNVRGEALRRVDEAAQLQRVNRSCARQIAEAQAVLADRVSLHSLPE